MKCGECKWWDKSKDYDGKGKWCKCMNPKSPGYKMWREWKNHLCKGYGEKAGDSEQLSNEVVAPKMTNYDSIRSMSVEELATFLFHAWNNASWCSAKDCPDEDSCLPCWLDWLRQECE